MLPRWNGNKWERSEEFLFWISLTNIRRHEEGRLC
jgi:predicted secreted Zn-dependent protease